MDEDDIPEDIEEEAVRVQARRLHQRAQWFSVEVPEQWYVTGDDFESFIGGLYHDRVRAKIRNAKWHLLTSGIGLVGGVLGVAAFVRSC